MPLLGGDAGERARRRRRSTAQASRAAVGGLGGVDGRVGGGVDDRVVVAPAAGGRERPGRVRSRSARVGELDVRRHRRTRCAGRAPSCPPAPRTRVLRGAIGVTSASRGCARSFAEISTSVERDRPGDGGGLVGEVEEGVRRVGRPVVVDEVGVGGVGLERLVRVADAARHEDRARRVELDGEHRAERSAPRAGRPRRRRCARWRPRPTCPTARRGCRGSCRRRR